jgi:hypothetical protein
MGVRTSCAADPPPRIDLGECFRCGLSAGYIGLELAVAVYASTFSRTHRRKGDQWPDVEREVTVPMRTMRDSLLLLGNPTCRLHLSLDGLTWGCAWMDRRRLGSCGADPIEEDDARTSGAS